VFKLNLKMVKYITGITLIFLLACSTISCKKDDGISKNEAELQLLRAELCTSDNTTPIPYKNFTGEIGEVQFNSRPGPDSVFYIVLNNKAEKLNICNFPSGFKKAGQKVQVEDTAYYFECTGSGPCGATEGTPFIIKSIKLL